MRIVRGLWSEPSLTHRGTIYHTEDAKLEPKPAHRIPIWLGTFGERALEVTGRVADGWIPSRGYVPDEALPAMRARVIVAAGQAGRDPADLTCALNTQVTVDDRHGRHPDEFTGPPAKIVDSVRRYAGLGFTALTGQDEDRRAEHAEQPARPPERVPLGQREDQAEHGHAGQDRARQVQPLPPRRGSAGLR